MKTSSPTKRRDPGERREPRATRDMSRRELILRRAARVRGKDIAEVAGMMNVTPQGLFALFSAKRARNSTIQKFVDVLAKLGVVAKPEELAR